ncbi:MAG: alcohol dehydrogenase catalytic domain-containing protein [Actinomycetota bacterium]|nr:alcohol dehydrogenase catalytic domain-containing protein [Actinomycetota bacterium]
MRAARIHGVRDVRVDDVDEPVPAPGHRVVRITGVGICGSDLHWFTEGGIGDAVLREPLVLGHEMAGVVEDGPLAGTHVGLDPAAPCGACEPCRDALEHLCPHMAFAGHGSTDGALRERMVWPEDRLVPLPVGLDGATGALLEPLGVAMHAVDLSHVRAGQTVGVVGCGPIGLLTIMVLRTMGCVVHAVEPLAHRRDAAAGAGAITAGDNAAPESLDACRSVFEVSGTDDGLESAGRMARLGGRVLLVGIPDGDRTSFPASLMRRKAITMAPVRRMTLDAYRRGVALVADGRLDPAPLATHRYPLHRAAEAFDVASRREGLKIVVDVAPAPS